MTTRSGLSYKAEMDGDTPTGATTTAATGVADRELINALMEDRRALQAHVEALVRVVEHSRSRDEEALAARTAPKEPKLTRFSEATDDIEAYLTTFERLMTAHHVDGFIAEYFIDKMIPKAIGVDFMYCQSLTYRDRFYVLSVPNL